MNTIRSISTNHFGASTHHNLFLFPKKYGHISFTWHVDETGIRFEIGWAIKEREELIGTLCVPSSNSSGFVVREWGGSHAVRRWGWRRGFGQLRRIGSSSTSCSTMGNAAGELCPSLQVCFSCDQESMISGREFWGEQECLGWANDLVLLIQDCWGVERVAG